MKTLGSYQNSIICSTTPLVPQSAISQSVVQRDLLAHRTTLWAYMGMTRSTLPRNNGNLPLPFFCGNYSIFLLNNVHS